METNYNVTKITVAEKRIEELIERYNLNPIVLDYFKKGIICYSYITGGIIGSLDTISYNSKYEQAIKDFESQNKGCLVYHVIESITLFGTQLSFLYVDATEKVTTRRFHKDGIVRAYVANTDNPAFSDFGSIQISNYGYGGSLIRVI